MAKVNEILRFWSKFSAQMAVRRAGQGWMRRGGFRSRRPIRHYRGAARGQAASLYRPKPKRA